MKRLSRLWLLGILSLLLIACQAPAPSDQVTETTGYQALANVEREDGRLQASENLAIQTLEAADKTQLYTEWDNIVVDSQGTTKPSDYSHIQELESEAAYQKWLALTQDTAGIIYFGFDECPACRAFTPKVQVFAQSFDEPLAYYNTQRRSEDANFLELMEFYGVTTVPHAFAVQEGDILAEINHNSSMAQIESFFLKLQEVAEE